MSSSTDIVQVNVSISNAPAPNTLQRSGAFISQGGTDTAAGTLTLVSNLAGLTSILSSSLPLVAMTETSNVVTGTTSAPHGWTIGDTIGVVITGVAPAGYNGSFQATVTSTTQFTYPLVASPGSATVQGSVILASQGELLSMGTTYFALTGAPPVYVLELGEGTATEGVAALSAFITNFGNRLAATPPGIYSYLVPREWDNNSAFLALLTTFTAPAALTYFFVTTIVANRAVYAGKKCVLALVEAPSIPATEFSLASAFAVTLNYNPTSTNRVTPLSYSFLFGVTAYPVAGSGSTFTELQTANVGWVGTGAEGGLTNTILFQGQMQDGNPWNYWYGADWLNINAHLNCANEVINGSNNPLAPLYYDQNGINRLQNRTAQTAGSAITNGLANGKLLKTQLAAQDFANNYEAGLYEGFIVVNAEPFLIYQNENPDSYAAGTYGGIAIADTPSRGFLQVLIDLNITNLIA